MDSSALKNPEKDDDMRVRTPHKTDPHVVQQPGGLLDPRQEHKLKWFEWNHLPVHLQDISRPFQEMAKEMVRVLPRNEERSVCLRKLMEAKDCAVRSFIDK